MNKKILITISFAIIFLLVFLVTKISFFSKSNVGISPNIMYITPPILSFSGMVEKIEGNQVIISYTIYPNSNISPTPAPVKLTYKVIVDKNTVINRPSDNVHLTIKDIIVNRQITVTSNIDLRQVTNNQFTAATITLPVLITTINGRIIAVKNNILTIKAKIPTTNTTNALSIANPVLQKEADYQVKVSDNTEVFRSATPTPPAAVQWEKISLSDLKIGTSINVYSKEDVVLTQNLTALRIEIP